MKYEFLVNGCTSLVLCPENTLEEELLKSLAKQTNEIIELRTAVTVINKTVKGGVMITKLGSIGKAPEPENRSNDSTKDESM